MLNAMMEARYIPPSPSEGASADKRAALLTCNFTTFSDKELKSSKCFSKIVSNYVELGGLYCLMACALMEDTLSYGAQHRESAVCKKSILLIPRAGLKAANE